MAVFADENAEERITRLQKREPAFIKAIISRLRRSDDIRKDPQGRGERVAWTLLRISLCSVNEEVKNDHSATYQNANVSKYAYTAQLICERIKDSRSQMLAAKFFFFCFLFLSPLAL